jgi:hypothetical protein
MSVELRPDRKIASHFHTLLSVATALLITVLVVLFADATVRGLIGLVIYVGAYVVSVQVALTGVFIDFYLKEKHTRWAADDKGIKITRMVEDDEVEQLVSWDDVAWINPRDHRITLAIVDTPHPQHIYFVPPDQRKAFYDMYLMIKVYPFMNQEDDGKEKRAAPRGVLAYDPLEEQWDPRRMQ